MSTQRSAEQSSRLTELATEEIRALLARRKLSAAKLAKRMGKTQTYLSRRMTGEVALDLDDLEIIARELGVTVPELLSGDGRGGRNAQATVAKVTDAERPPAYQPIGRASALALIPTMRRPARIDSLTSRPNG